MQTCLLHFYLCFWGLTLLQSIFSSVKFFQHILLCDVCTSKADILLTKQLHPDCPKQIGSTSPALPKWTIPTVCLCLALEDSVPSLTRTSALSQTERELWLSQPCPMPRRRMTALKLLLWWFPGVQYKPSCFPPGQAGSSLAGPWAGSWHTEEGQDHDMTRGRVSSPRGSAHCHYNYN